MKKVLLTLALVTCGLSSVVHANQPKIKEIGISINSVLVPESTERTAEAKVVLSGNFPNSCYRWSRADVKHTSAMTHEIRAKAFVTVDTMCLMVLVPYIQEVSLGILAPGEHNLKFYNGDGTFFERKMQVR